MWISSQRENALTSIRENNVETHVAAVLPLHLGKNNAIYVSWVWKKMICILHFALLKPNSHLLHKIAVNRRRGYLVFLWLFPCISFHCLCCICLFLPPPVFYFKILKIIRHSIFIVFLHHTQPKEHDPWSTVKSAALFGAVKGQDNGAYIRHMARDRTEARAPAHRPTPLAWDKRQAMMESGL